MSAIGAKSRWRDAQGEGHMKRLVQLFSKDDGGSDVREYGIIAAALAVALVAVLGQIGGHLNTPF
jgi:pilus assembly protein Flp/PilA